MALLRLGLAQINATVGDFAGNRQKITAEIEKARIIGCDLVAFPELAVTGYPPEDLLFKPDFVRQNHKTLEAITGDTKAITAVIGFVDGQPGCLYNAAAVIHNRRLKAIYHKIVLPNYGVFDEQRYFKPGNQCPVLLVGGIQIGLNICEDIWFDDGPVAVQAASGAQLILNISSSPYHTAKWRQREELLTARSREYGVIISYVNLVGGQDELVFDGGSLVTGRDGKVLARAPQFEESLLVVDLDTAAMDTVINTRAGANRPKSPDFRRKHYLVSRKPSPAPKPKIQNVLTQPLDPAAEVYQALVTGTRDYVTKNGFGHVVIGLSGGIDSSLVAAVAVDALGNQKVTGVAMPSCYSSEASLEDAQQLAGNLHIDFLTISIEVVYRAYLATLAEAFKGSAPDITEENIQARIRGNLLMALSNKFGWLVLTTGNKSEMATGYTTLYGDMAGGFAVIKDVPKTLVYELCLYRNKQPGGKIVPDRVLAKPPSAELRPNQRDSDTLPPYEILDPILTAYVEEDREVAEILKQGFEQEAVRRTARLVDMSEYKRRQSPPGVKITSRAFGRDRRLPITNRFRGV